ncbi:hypothetical protein PACILC2_22520 [Paenibacillus cisolokensis]|uniref:Adenylate kinase n=1 Tax=Paenibacillus cisolokensis TaxID=1658519 RepID=A0ABQ4N645_9BACL|nr:adenylate kinase [Paenibacillus cisolokensis]GIQ63684.1 hypothetical protein PACILC2_22520 [Paenibacillus cisolokensis]
MTTLPNIAITGQIRSGKDTVGRILFAKYGYTRFAFGDAIRRYARDIFPSEFENGRKPRELLQWFGQTMRERDPDVWVRKCFESIEFERAVTAAYGGLGGIEKFHAVITDLRQPNEYERCRTEGFVIIRVSAPESLRIHRAINANDTFDLRDFSHETESYVDTFAVDYEIENTGNWADLERKIDEIMMRYLPQ